MAATNNPLQAYSCPSWRVSQGWGSSSTNIRPSSLDSCPSLGPKQVIFHSGSIRPNDQDWI